MCSINAQPKHWIKKGGIMPIESNLMLVASNVSFCCVCVCVCVCTSVCPCVYVFRVFVRACDNTDASVSCSMATAIKPMPFCLSQRQTL